MIRILHAALLLGAATPLGIYAYRFFTRELGPNPVEEITHASGRWTLYLLLASLSITPLRRLLHYPALIQVRRSLGLYSFLYGSIHLFTWIWLDKFFDTQAMEQDLLEKRYLAAGLASFGLMLPLAITSTRGWIIRLGGLAWRRLHRLVYLSAAAGLLHYFWLVKSDLDLPLGLAACFLLLLLLRVDLAKIWRHLIERRYKWRAQNAE